MICREDPLAHPVPHRLAIFWRHEAGEDGRRGCTLLVTGGALHLNSSAAAIWAMIDGRRDIGEIAAALGDIYPQTDADELRSATRQLLAELARAGAVVETWTPLDPLPAPRLRAAARWL